MAVESEGNTQENQPHVVEQHNTRGASAYQLRWIYAKKTHKYPIPFVCFQAHPHLYYEPIKFETCPCENLAQIFIQRRNVSGRRIAHKSQFLETDIRNKKEYFTSSQATSAICPPFESAISSPLKLTKPPLASAL